MLDGDPSDVSYHASYKRFRRRIIEGSRCEAPTASTPLTTGGQCQSSFEFDPVCQRLELDSPPRHQRALQKEMPGKMYFYFYILQAIISFAGGLPRGSRGWPEVETTLVWKAAFQQHAEAQQTGSVARKHDLQPFDILDKTTESVHGKSVMKLAAPSLLNDYYTDLLDCSCNGVIALALGSSVYIWNSETYALMGHLNPSPEPQQPSGLQTVSISCLCWSRDGRSLCIGTRRGDIQLWDVDHKQNMRCLLSHSSVVRALSWNQHLLSSASVLGQIHHLDPRAPTSLVGAASHTEGICSLEWSPGGDRLASGSTDGLLCVWDSDVTRSHHPITTMKQPSAVKAMAWCPWQSKMIATGGGWNDGKLRLWDANSETCVASADTNSQICSLRWAEKKRYLVTGHGLPQHNISCWTWESSSFSPTCQLRVACHDIAVGRTISHYLMVQRPMSWFQARDFCKKHYMDLASLGTEEQYLTLLNSTAEHKVSFWLGLQRQSIFADWKWVDREELNYDRWYRRNYAGHCASLEAMLEQGNKLLGRYCEELHMFVCQGPRSPQSLMVDSVDSDHVTLSWNVSTFMQTMPHSYSVTTCASACHTFLLPYTDDSASMHVNISNLTSSTDYFIEVSAVVVRPDSDTVRNMTLLSLPTVLQVRTADSPGLHQAVLVIRRLMKLISLLVPLWILYRILKNTKFSLSYEVKRSELEVLPMELSIEETTLSPIMERTRGFG
ncbi:uncharacterized protein V6R79_007581 [Siganus canaliculatus]